MGEVSPWNGGDRETPRACIDEAVMIKMGVFAENADKSHQWGWSASSRTSERGGISATFLQRLPA